MGYTIATLSDLREHGYVLRGHCGAERCGHSMPLALDLLIARYGPDYSCVGDDRLRNVLRCVHCGRKGGQITLSARQAEAAVRKA